ncbi:hypothetical protein PN36_25450 [Candidatus Thiomargarita nelsonii]|uniref:Uncharacterized protein n=1 Tax=Candidatus Thiomargarita nelsonii TaxID=1003181 RepID=A0A0A6P5P4_9GAMM|nr:hypothetical protein PN36_25450 [Candidatus Thiomargarita nelsonii]
MPDHDILCELFRKEARVALEDGDYGKKAVTLNEPKCDDHKGYSVVISNMPEDAVVIKGDAFPSPTTIFSNSRGECKRADFVIVANIPIKKKTRNLIIFIEMKKGKGGSELEIIQQLKGAWCVIDYCRSIGQRFWKQESFLNPNDYDYRFVSIRDIAINKKPTRISPLDGLHDSPERMLKINSPHHLQFKQLVGAV